MAKKLNSTSTNAETVDDTYDDYESYDDYEYGLNYDQSTTASKKGKTKEKLAKKPIEMKPIKEDIKVGFGKENKNFEHVL